MENKYVIRQTGDMIHPCRFIEIPIMPLVCTVTTMKPTTRMLLGIYLAGFGVSQVEVEPHR